MQEALFSRLSSFFNFEKRVITKIKNYSTNNIVNVLNMLHHEIFR